MISQSKAEQESKEWPIESDVSVVFSGLIRGRNKCLVVVDVFLQVSEIMAEQDFKTESVARESTGSEQQKDSSCINKEDANSPIDQHNIGKY